METRFVCHNKGCSASHSFAVAGRYSGNNLYGSEQIAGKVLGIYVQSNKPSLQLIPQWLQQSNLIGVETRVDANYRFNYETKQSKRRRLRRFNAYLRYLAPRVAFPTNGNWLLSCRTPNSFPVRGGQIRPIRKSEQWHTNQNSFGLENDVLPLPNDIKEYFDEKMNFYLKRQEKANIPEKDEVFSAEEMLINQAEPTLQLQNELKMQTNSNPREMLERATTDSEFSKQLVRSLPNMEESSMQGLIDVITSDFFRFVDNENTCYIVKLLAKKNELITKLANNLVFKSLNAMILRVHTCRLVYTLCIYSDKFREGLLIAAKSQFIHLISSVPGAILISVLVNSMKDFKKCKFIEDHLKKNPQIIKTKFFCRAFTSYMKKCPLESLDIIAGLLKPNLNFLLNDNYGNYLLQIFFDRGSKPGIEMCQEALLKNHRKAFLRKYSRFVLLKALGFGEPDFPDRIAFNLSKDFSAAELVMKSKFSQHLLLVGLSRMQSRETLKNSLANIIGICETLLQTVKRQNEAGNYIGFMKELRLIERYCSQF